MLILPKSFALLNGAIEAFDCMEAERHRNWQS